MPLLERLTYLANSAVQSRTCLFFVLLLIAITQAFTYHYIYNEYDVLPSVLQQARSSWLPHDWYLSLDIGYRQLFNAIAGYFIAWFDFQWGNYALRIALYASFCFAFLRLAKANVMPPLATLLAFLLFVHFQSIAWDEWIIGGSETKTLAYTFSLLAIAYTTEYRYRWALVFAGLATSFHVLVGIYASFCLGLAILALPSHRRHFLEILKSSWLWFIFSANGLYFLIVSQLNAELPANPAMAWEYYVKFRVPHHTLPEYWLKSQNTWIFYVSLIASIAPFLINELRSMRILAAQLLGCYLLILIGLLLYQAGDETTMRYFFFRYADTMIPLVTFCITAATFISMLKRLEEQFSLATAPLTQWAKLAGYFFIALSLSYASYKFVRTMQWHHQQTDRPEIASRKAVNSWIKNTLTQDVVILIPPFLQEFYVEAQRSPFVSFKHTPQSALNMAEWITRMELLNQGPLPIESLPGFDARDDVHRHYFSLSPSAIEAIHQAYPEITHLLSSSESDYPFPLLYGNDVYKVYALP